MYPLDTLFMNDPLKDDWLELFADSGESLWKRSGFVLRVKGALSTLPTGVLVFREESVEVGMGEVVRERSSGARPFSADGSSS